MSRPDPPWPVWLALWLAITPGLFLLTSCTTPDPTRVAPQGIYLIDGEPYLCSHIYRPGDPPIFGVLCSPAKNPLGGDV